ncbi:amidohydrolase family protein [Polynucleobacter sp. TSB-Sco08W16]|uniref:amidohydrolase family protein n=1 Tax=Polynucleobacter sp. TSB-Sco08W16 TaxID=1758374 RepID=UPI001BFD5646|nr:amidohydrolase family protein [Polynucleobacter sp. TSB-Sco08W16]QWD74731.1 amidohydrolase family protein [Polynucleobacter sp. TSB-Sco08W16]
MNNRRSFLKTSGKALGGLFFCGCGLAHAADTETKKRVTPVFINGKRIKTIDVHAHCMFQDAIDLMGEDAASVPPPTKGVPEHFIKINERIKAMEAQGIDMQVLSVNPYWYRKDKETAAEICRLNNLHLAELCALRPEKFAAFASLTMQFPDLAVEQLEYAVKKQGLKGAAIGGSVLGQDFSDPKFHPVLAKAQELNATLFIHPQSTPQLAQRFKGNGWMSNVIGNPLDTTISLQHLIYEGVLDKYPQLKVLAAHGGGFLGSYAPRMDHSCFVSPQNCDPNIVLKKKPSEYLKQLYFDSLVFTPEALQYLVSQVGASQVVIGTDHPIPWEEFPVEHVMATPGLSNADRIAILGGNAERLLNIKLN